MDGITVVVILSITAVLVFILNVFCVSIIVRNQQLRSKPSSILTANLLSMHILQAVATMPFYALKRLPETNSNFVCSGFRFFYILTFYIACFCVLLISLDRFLAFRLKMKYRTTVTSQRVKYVLALVWVYIITLCCIPFAYRTEKCSYNPPPHWVVFMLLVNCFLPCLIIVGIYTYIMVCLRRFEKLKNKKTSQSGGMVTISKSNKRITRNTMILVATYGIAWLPSIIFYLIQSLFPEVFSDSYYDSTEDQYISFFLKYIKFVEGITSPILYCYLNTFFRKTVMELFCMDTSAIRPEQSEFQTQAVIVINGKASSD